MNGNDDDKDDDDNDEYNGAVIFGVALGGLAAAAFAGVDFLALSCTIYRQQEQIKELSSSCSCCGGGGTGKPGLALARQTKSRLTTDTTRGSRANTGQKRGTFFRVSQDWKDIDVFIDVCKLTNSRLSDNPTVEYWTV